MKISDFEYKTPVIEDIRKQMTRLSEEQLQLAMDVSRAQYSMTRNYTSHTHFNNSGNYRFVATCGEIFFADWVGQEYEYAGRVGDGGVDRTLCGHTVQVKTINISAFNTIDAAVNHQHLLVKEGEAQAEFYIVVLYVDIGFCRMSRWTTQDTVMSVQPSVWPQHISNHSILLRDMEPLITFGPTIRGEL